MKQLSFFVLLVASSLSIQSEAFEPSVPDMHAFKVYHHAEYMKKTAMQAGGTNKLLHTRTLPTEGNDPVVTPALDHLYSKAVIDLTEGPVVLSLPEVGPDRYFSIMITDQEHYVIYDETRPVGDYVFIKSGWTGKVPLGTVIETRSTFPHLFIRTQVKTPDDIDNTLAIQEKVRLKGAVGTFEYDDPIQFTLETHEVYPQNGTILVDALGYDADDHKAMSAWAGDYFAKNITDNAGMFGPIDSVEPGAQDPRVRAAAMIGHLGFPTTHAYYTGIFINCDGRPLNGSVPYTVTLPYEANIREFWSVTRYSALTRNTLPGKNDVYNAYNTEPNKDGMVVITFSAEDPGDDTYWIPVNDGEPYYYVERFYGPKGKVTTTLDGCPAS